MTAQTVWSLSFPERLELQLLREGRQRVWRAAGEGWSKELPRLPGTALWLPAVPAPDALRRVSWWGMKELGVAWGEAIQLSDSVWLCPLLAQRVEERTSARIERIFLGARHWGLGNPQLLVLVVASPDDGMRLALAAFLGLKEERISGMRVPRISLLLPRDAELQVWRLLERHGVRPPVPVLWARTERFAASASAGQADLEI